MTPDELRDIGVGVEGGRLFVLEKRERAMEPGAIGYVSYRGTATLLAMRDGVMHGTLHLESPGAARKIDVEHAVCNYIAFGNKNSALVAGCG